MGAELSTKLDTQNSDNVKLTGGTVDGITIGQTTPAAASVTSLLSRAGASSGAPTVRGNGNISLQIVAAGNGNGADTTDDVLMTFQLPANALDVAGRQITITAAGTFATNSHNKEVKCFWGATSPTVGSAISGGTNIADSGVVTTSNGGWWLQAIVQKYGANGSNTQLAQGQVIAGSTHTGTNVPVALTNTESAAINIAITGASGTTGAASDVLCQMLEITYSN